MSNKAKLWIGFGMWGVFLIGSMSLWGYAREDPFAMLLTVFRILVVAPLIMSLGWAAIRVISGPGSPGPDWLEVLTDDQKTYTIGTKIAVGLVVSTVLLCLSWIGIQG